MRIRTVGPVLGLSFLVCALGASTAAAQTSKSTGEAKYQIAMAVMADAKWDAIRYDVTSGKTWHIVEGKWQAMKDVGTLPTSRYEVHIVPLKNDWGAMRIDVMSGRSWTASPEGWVEVGAAPEEAEAKP